MAKNKKRCSKCGDDKDFSAFHKCKTKKFGLSNWCKECKKIHRQENKEALAKKAKIHYQENKEKIAERKKIHRQENKEKYAERKKIYLQENKEKIAERKEIYRQENKEKIAERQKIHYQENKEKIADTYIAGLFKMPRKYIPKEAIKAKRVVIYVKRESDKLKLNLNS